MGKELVWVLCLKYWAYRDRRQKIRLFCCETGSQGTLFDTQNICGEFLYVCFSSCCLLLSLEMQLTRSGPQFPLLASCFNKDYIIGALRPLGEIPPPACSSPCNEVTPDMIYPASEFQSKQQLAVFSSLRLSVDPLQEACNSLQRKPPDIPTQCFSDTHSATLVKHLCCNKKKAKKKSKSPL